MPSLSRPPEYGSPEWHALDKDDPRRREAVLFAADCWRLLMSSPHVSDLLAEWVEWMHRKTAREASWAISAATDWRSVADAPTYAELEHRRGNPPRVRGCDWKLCGEAGTPHLSRGTRLPVVLCAAHSHLGIPEEMSKVPAVDEARRVAQRLDAA